MPNANEPSVAYLSVGPQLRGYGFARRLQLIASAVLEARQAVEVLQYIARRSQMQIIKERTFLYVGALDLRHRVPLDWCQHPIKYQNKYIISSVIAALEPFGSVWRGLHARDRLCRSSVA